MVRTIALAGLVAATLLAGMGAGSIGSAAAARGGRVASPSIAGDPGNPQDPISCSSPTFCLWLDDGGAMALEGTRWKAISVPEPINSDERVSCTTATYCLVSGTDDEYYETYGPYILRWNGTSLASIPAPPVPDGYTLVSIDAISCVAVKSCVVFGTAGKGADEDVELAWTWNGSKWAMKGTAYPAGWGRVFVSSARCFSLTSCEVTGAYGPMLFAAWNGRKFTLQRAPEEFADNADGADAGNVSCGSPGSCAAISSINSTDSFLTVWNGKTWTATKWTGPPYSDSFLGDVSCMTAASCLAVGYSTSDNRQVEGAVSLVWNGRKWRTAGVPGVGPGLQTSFDNVSCPTADKCVAVGWYWNYLSSGGGVLACYWNGKSWKLTRM
jgi:hypothetical protein